MNLILLSMLQKYTFYDEPAPERILKMPNSNNSVIIIAVGAASVAVNGVEGSSRLAVPDFYDIGTMFGGASGGFLGAKKPRRGLRRGESVGTGRRPPFKTREIYASIFIQFF